MCNAYLHATCKLGTGVCAITQIWETKNAGREDPFALKGNLDWRREYFCLLNLRYSFAQHKPLLLYCTFVSSGTRNRFRRDILKIEALVPT